MLYYYGLISYISFVQLSILMFCEQHYYLKKSGSNGKQQSDDEEKDEGDGCVSHVVFFFHRVTGPFVVRFYLEPWM